MPKSTVVNLIKKRAGVDLPFCHCLTVARASCIVCHAWVCRFHIKDHEHWRDNEIPELLPPRINGAVVRKFWKPREFKEGLV